MSSLIHSIGIDMILIFFVFVILSRLPLFHSATPNDNSMPICPVKFTCPALTTFKYPFYNGTDTRCGLIKVNCTAEGGEIQIGGNRYRILSKFDFHGNSSRLFLWNRIFRGLVKNKSCEALMNNFISPSPRPLLYSISIVDFINLFKCQKNLTYFKQHKYNSYNGCKDHNFYYNYSNTTVPNDLPHTCQVVQLPVNTPSALGFNESNIFSLLYPGTSTFFNLSHSCSKCQDQNRSCGIAEGVVYCFDVKKVSPSSNPENPGRDRKIKILVFVGGSIAILILSFVIFIIWRQCKNNPFTYVSTKNKSQNLKDISLSCGISVFSYKELENATQNFDPSRELGDGGFGSVYYGKLKDGREVAVKKLHEHNYNRVQHFRNEVEILTKLRHPNLVVLYGCTSRQSHELLLVYEYVPNGTVADHLHGEQVNPCMLTWPIRMNIAIETASALAYLHASEIIHRDVKTNNILLDHNFCVKVADFGLSRLISNNVTHVSTAPQGTPGYLDPQYHQRYQLTDKSDVYSFGVVLIELISSMVAVDLDRSQDEISLANLALSKIKRCAIDELIDPVLGSDMNPEIMNMITLVAELAFRCLQYDLDMRPTMNEVLEVLMDIQSVGRIDVYDSIRDLQTVNVQPLSETNDEVILLKDFVCSRVSVTSERKSNNSVSTTLSSSGDRSSVKNEIDT
ncbi:LEAF RUST 10 DISEASE-RESISTANCE LOCUS RECEPTOR-LIKE PROTEIN KINASE-like 1.1 [Bidens hawaiensis]|uniref:LEAF RUST 10 DISEASE-RESISTANCE LOCUS RECEPTOR-LIKE PROTEIN KINASE-like 1.1 n=1 Tax=Bidens hawaiensis TaxID=980011 RepID=UPI00404B7707